MKYDEAFLIDGTFVFPNEQTIYIFGAGVDAETAYKKIKKSGARVDPYADLQTALESKNHAAAIVALCSIMADEGVDAEVALNAEVRGIIENL